MGAINAQILIGQSHSYDGGIINISHSMYLSENGTARWILRSENIYGDKCKEPVIINWVPHINSILEDGLLMIGLFIWKDKELLKLAEKLFKKSLGEFEIINSSVIEDDDLKRLHQRCRSLDIRSKLIITALDGSSVLRELELLEKYKMEVEVCKTVYTRSFNAWENQINVKGSLS